MKQTLIFLFFLFSFSYSFASVKIKNHSSLKRVELRNNFNKDDVTCAGVALPCGGETTLCVYNPNGRVTATQMTRAIANTIRELCP